jgi:hypothetical protein
MDEGVHVAELQLDCSANLVELHDPREITNNLEPTLNITPVIIGKLKNKQVAENRFGHHKIPRPSGPAGKFNS